MRLTTKKPCRGLRSGFIALALFGAAVTTGSLMPVGPARAGQMHIYMVSHGGPGDPFWTPVVKGAKAAGKALGVKVTWENPQRQGNVDGEVRLLNSAIAANPAAIGVTVPSASAFAAPLREAKQDGVPVIAFNTVPKGTPSSKVPYLGYVGQNNFIAGEDVAKHAIKVFGLHKGEVVAGVNHQSGNISLTQRLDGMKKTFQDKGIKFRELAVQGSNPPQAESAIQSFISKYKNVHVLLTVGPLGYRAVAHVLQSNGLVGKIQLTGFDLDQKGLQLIKKGVMKFTWDQLPYVQGYMTVTELYLKAKYGFNPTPVYNTGVGLINKSNVNKWEKLTKAKL